MIFNITCLP